MKPRKAVKIRKVSVAPDLPVTSRAFPATSRQILRTHEVLHFCLSAWAGAERAAPLLRWLRPQLVTQHLMIRICGFGVYHCSSASARLLLP